MLEVQLLLPRHPGIIAGASILEMAQITEVHNVKKTYLKLNVLKKVNLPGPL